MKKILKARKPTPLQAAQAQIATLEAQLATTTEASNKNLREAGRLRTRVSELTDIRQAERKTHERLKEQHLQALLELSRAQGQLQAFATERAERSEVIVTTPPHFTSGAHGEAIAAAPQHILKCNLHQPMMFVADSLSNMDGALTGRWGGEAKPKSWVNT